MENPRQNFPPLFLLCEREEIVDGMLAASFAIRRSNAI
jgi:hypothetical protein